MCGIVGIVSENPQNVSIDRLKRMTDVIHYRGPDGDGHWISVDGKTGLGHRRLSIIDLSEGGHQPMHYANERYTITFNGEIYNYLEIKEKLLPKGYKFQSTSDTEVLLALYDFQQEACLNELDGMFAFAIYDKKQKTLFCARDRFGEKPFFYAYKPGEYFLFGSEMKTLWAAGIEKKVKNQMLYNYISFDLLENPNNKSETFYENIFRLENAHYLKLNTNDIRLEKKEYWNIDLNKVNPAIKEQDAISQFHELFFTSVKRRLRSDVPVGSSLSGGLDSSLIVCVINELNRNNNLKQKTFSARFPGYKKDEGDYMQMVIDQTNVEPFFTFPQQADLDEINKVFYHQEEPFGSASILVQYQVMKLAKENGVIVLLDGQGADELLGGYHSYFQPYLRELKKSSNSSYKKALADYKDLHADNGMDVIDSDFLKSTIKQYVPSLIKPLRRIKHKISYLSNPFYDKNFFIEYSKNQYTDNEDNIRVNSLNGALYYSTYVKGLSELLRYADRNSMAHSREVRLPFLSHALVEFLFTLPADFKINNGWTKYIMRKTFNNILPQKIAWRKDKIGYEPPQKQWMEHKETTEMIQRSKEVLVKEHILNKQVLEKKPKAFDANIKGDNSWHYWMAGNLFL